MRCNHGAAIFFSSRYIRGIIDVSELCRKAIGGGGITGNLLSVGIGFKFTVRYKYPVLCRRKCK